MIAGFGLPSRMKCLRLLSRNMGANSGLKLVKLSANVLLIYREMANNVVKDGKTTSIQT